MEPLLFQYQYSQFELYSIFTTRQWIEIILDKFREEQKDAPEHLTGAFRTFMNNLLIYECELKEHDPMTQSVQNLNRENIEEILRAINFFHLQLIKYLEPQNEKTTLQKTPPKAVCR